MPSAVYYSAFFAFELQICIIKVTIIKNCVIMLVSK